MKQSKIVMLMEQIAESECVEVGVKQTFGGCCEL